jgi:hypothetical protein
MWTEEDIHDEPEGSAAGGLLKAALARRISNAQRPRSMQLSVRQFHRVKVRFAAVGAKIHARAVTLLQGPMPG